MTTLEIDSRTIEMVLDDHYASAGDDLDLAGTLVETDYGLLWLSQGYPILATGTDCREWNYSWVLLDDIREEDYGFSARQVWDSAARSTTRVEVKSKQTYTYEWEADGETGAYTPEDHWA